MTFPTKINEPGAARPPAPAEHPPLMGAILSAARAGTLTIPLVTEPGKPSYYDAVKVTHNGETYCISKTNSDRRYYLQTEEGFKQRTFNRYFLDGIKPKSIDGRKGRKDQKTEVPLGNKEEVDALESIVTGSPQKHTTVSSEDSFAQQPPQAGSKATTVSVPPLTAMSKAAATKPGVDLVTLEKTLLQLIPGIYTSNSSLEFYQENANQTLVPKIVNNAKPQNISEDNKSTSFFYNELGNLILHVDKSNQPFFDITEYNLSNGQKRNRVGKYSATFSDWK